MCTINTIETYFSVNVVLYFVHQSPSIDLPPVPKSTMSSIKCQHSLPVNSY